ncbi:MAG: FmdB family transcriptional regulator [Candidatus Lindowbacteria bacterium RIFCSPLOWO2_12_FULL_62_27]|nr:MAG: FmdB family transcriptional regulator [Candidatus Lindowbacteria bacterium RIFCSPLOWO2_02_FULL_62_12]OGH62610.1 MAG: FmdB family transcriptional regulator [Candidatus Lindowbacteria bacterium RIFCSPLOWO2_12_FULL_62_27]
MPTYDYECGSCGHRWEAFQNMTARPAKKCPDCGRPKARRLLTAGGGVLFKGSGFHTTDYRSESYKKAASADSVKSGGASTPKSEGKPAASKPAEK